MVSAEGDDEVKPLATLPRAQSPPMEYITNSAEPPAPKKKSGSFRGGTAGLKSMKLTAKFADATQQVCRLCVLRGVAG